MAGERMPAHRRASDCRPRRLPAQTLLDGRSHPNRWPRHSTCRKPFHLSHPKEPPMPTSVLTMAAKQAMPRQSAVRRATADYVPRVERNVGPTERLVSLGLGTCLTVFGLTGRRVSPLALTAGGFLLYRGLAGNCPLYQALGVGTGGTSGEAAVMPARAGVKVEHAVTVNRPAAEVYRFWRNLSRLPEFIDRKSTRLNSSH